MRSSIPGLLLLLSAALAQGEEVRPADLPHELIELRDGRHLAGRYDPAAGVLWLDGTGNARLRVPPDDIRRRIPIADAGARPRGGEIGVAHAPQVDVAGRRLALVAELERERAEVTHLQAEAERYLARLNEGVEQWRVLYAEAEQRWRESPGTGIGFENGRSHTLAKMRLSIAEALGRQQRQRELVTALAQRRQRVAAELAQARRALETTPAAPAVAGPVTVVVSDSWPADPRLERLEAEVLRMRQDNERLRELLERMLELRPPAPPPAVVPSVAGPLANRT